MFGYFADRYDFEVVATVIPSGSHRPTASAAATLAELADPILRDTGIPAVFAEQTASSDLADTLAAEVASDVEVVALFAECLGDGGLGGRHLRCDDAPQRTTHRRRPRR